MRDIAHKPTTERTAIAEARLLMRPSSVALVRDDTGPKPDIVPTAKAACYLAVKHTHMAIPLCHPIPVDFIQVAFEFLEGEIRIEVEVKAVYKTGVEIEALHGASIAALTVYDMVKPVDTEIEIAGIKLLSKRGGKSDRSPKGNVSALRALVLVCSDAVRDGQKDNAAGEIVAARLREMGLGVRMEVCGGARAAVEGAAREALSAGCDLLLTVGGTGLLPEDQTPEAIAPLLDREAPGIMEAVRSHGQARTPKAMGARGLAGVSGKALVICLPGSRRGARESMDAVFPAALHIVQTLQR